MSDTRKRVKGLENLGDSEPKTCNYLKLSTIERTDMWGSLHNKYDNKADIPVLNANEHTSVVIDAPCSLFDRYKGDEMEFYGIITFKESIITNSRTSYPFYLSLKHYGNSAVIENEELKTMFEMQKLPKKLDDLKNELNDIKKKYQ